MKTQFSRTTDEQMRESYYIVISFCLFLHKSELARRTDSN